MKKIIDPAKIWLNVIPPPSKSIAIRAVAAGFLALLSDKNEDTQIVINNFSQCDDAKTAMEIIASLGFVASLSESNSLTIAKKLTVTDDTEEDAAADATVTEDTVAENQNSFDSNLTVTSGESALCYRMFPFVLSHLGREITLTPEGSLKKRNNEQLFNFLKMFGVNEQATDSGQITIKNKIKSGNYAIDCSHSSQELTGLLLALPLCAGDSTLEVSNLNSLGYIDLTLDILQNFGIEIKILDDAENSKKTFFIKGNQKFKQVNFSVESDWSAAANFLVLGAIAGKVTIANMNVNSLQPDREIFSLLQSLNIECNEISSSTVRVNKTDFAGFEFDATHCPDLIPPLVVLAFNAKSSSKIHGIERLVNKESNRRDILLKVFSLLGGKIKISGNSFEIFPSTLSGGFADSHDDHRIAMAVAIAAKRGINSTTITGSECVDKSFPDFWNYSRSRNG